MRAALAAAAAAGALALAACGDDEDEPATPTTTPTTTTTTVQPEPTSNTPAVPEETGGDGAAPASADDPSTGAPDAGISEKPGGSESSGGGY